MSTWYEAHENLIGAVNITMAELFENGDISGFVRTWRGTAQALNDSIPEDFESDWPEEFALAQSLGPDFVGVTSDTRKVVGWGPETTEGYRLFEVH